MAIPLPLARSLVLLGVALVAGQWAAAGDGPLVLPRVATAPTIDGSLADPCWTSAVALAPFSVPTKGDAPGKRIEAGACCDADALYLGLTCSEPAPQRLAKSRPAHGGEVWQDDCVEVFLRASADGADVDQFILSPSGAQDERRVRGGITVDGWRPQWQASVAIAGDRWTAEIRIPAAALDLDRLRRGDALGLKVGRNDRVDGTLAVWPAHARYAGADDLADARVEAANLLLEADLHDGRSRWNFGAGQDQRFRGEERDGRRFVAVACQGGETTMYQELRLRPGLAYRFSARVLAPEAMQVRLRVPQAKAGVDERLDTPIDGRPDPQDVSATFVAGPEGKCLLILTARPGSKEARYEYGDLAIEPVGTSTRAGEPIPLPPGDEPTVVTKLQVTDSRVVRGFLGAPVDGTTASGRWDGYTWEYPDPQTGSGILYSYLHDDGLHLTFADADGFDAVVVRGGVKADLVRDARWDDPLAGTVVHRFTGRALSSSALMPERVRTDRISFWRVSDGRIADCSFFRIAHGAGGLPAPERHAVAGGAAAPDASLAEQLVARFGEQDRATRALAATAVGVAELALPAGRSLHLMLPPQADEQAIAAIGLDVDAGSPAELTLTVQDPTDPRLELHGADYRIVAPGRVRVVCDHADQIVAPGRCLWLTLRADRALALRSPIVEIYRVPRAQAEPQALVHRRFLLKAFYANLSEARPWELLRTRADETALFESMARSDEKEEAKRGGPWHLLGPWMRQLLETLQACRDIDREGRDDVVRQYHQWIYRQILKKEGMPPLPARFDAVAGAPEWASLAHQAWMLAREVPRWWIDNRMVPNGELGGEVGDDTDMFGNYAPYPMFERDGVGGMVLRAGALLADTADRQNIDRGVNRLAMDPLHAYEEGINHESIMAYWNYGDPVCLERCMGTAKALEAFTAKTSGGHRHFRSGSMGVSTLAAPDPQAWEGWSHALWMHPSLELCWYARQPRALSLLKEWADGWMEHQHPGQYASGLDLGAVEKVNESNEYPFWGGWGLQGSVFMFLADVLDDPGYVRPFNEWFESGKCWPAGSYIGEMVQAGWMSRSPKAQGAIDSRWDSVLYTTGNKAPLIAALKGDIEEFERFPHMYTSCECFTDRVFINPLTSVSIAYTGGYATRNKVNQTFAISWEGLGTDYAALVLAADRTRLKVLVCNLTDHPLAGLGRIWRLEHGEYAITSGVDRDGDDRVDGEPVRATRELTRGDAVEVALPPKAVVVLELEQVKRLDDPRVRADLALSPSEVVHAGTTLSCRVHNLGVLDAPATTATLRDASGRVVQTVPVPAIPAPLDLVPRSVAIAFAGIPADLAGWTVEVDPDRRIAEIFEGNNRVAVAPVADH